MAGAGEANDWDGCVAGPMSTRMEMTTQHGDPMQLFTRLGFVVLVGFTVVSRASHLAAQDLVMLLVPLAQEP